MDRAVTDCGCRGNGKCPVRPNLRTRRLRMSTNVKRGTESTARPAPRQLATSTDLKPEDVRTISEAVNPRIAEQQRRAIEVCDSRGDTPTGNLLQEILDQTERRIWFLYELSQADA